MAGIGASGIENLHVADISHTYHDDFNTFISPEIRRAMVAGGFNNVIAESAVSDNEVARRPGGLATIFEQEGLNLYFPDARFGAYELTVNRHAPAGLALYRQHVNPFLALAQSYQNNIPSVAEANGSLLTLFPTLTSEQRSQIIATYRTGRLGPDLWGNIISHELNVDTTTNIEREAPTGSRVFFYGAAHTFGRIQGQPFELTGRADMDTAFPGYTMAILRNSGERAMALSGSDDPDFLYYLDASGDAQIEDLRSVSEQRARPLRGENGLLARGTAALSAQQQPIPPARTTPQPTPRPTPSPETGNDDVITAPAETDEAEITVPGTSGDNNIFSPENLRNLPLGSIIGGAIGAWLASGIGNGIGRMLVMALGGLIGWMIGGNFGRSEHEGQDAPAASSTTDTQAPAAPAQTPVPQPAASQSFANALAFANVSSVNISAAFPTAHVPTGELPDAQNLVLPPVAEMPQRTTIIH